MGRIRRAYEWIGRVFDARGPRTSAGFISDVHQSTFDVFGTHRLADTQIAVTNATNTGALGEIELAHSQVPADRWRLYLSIQYLSLSVFAAQIIWLARVQRLVGGGFPTIQFTTDVSGFQNISYCVQNVVVAPEQFLVMHGEAIPNLGQIQMRLMWIEFPLGESFMIPSGPGPAG